MMLNMHTSLFALALLAQTLAPTTALADEQPPAPEEYAPPKSKVAAPSDPSGTYMVPRSVLYQGGDIPSNAHIETKPNVAFIVSGVSIFGSAYVTSLIYGLSTCGAQSECRKGSGWLYLPLVGPFVTAAQAPTTGGQALAAFDGGVQVLGATLAIVGFALPRRFVTWQNKSMTLTVTPGMASAPGPSLPSVAASKPDFGTGLSITLTHL